MNKGRVGLIITAVISGMKIILGIFLSFFKETLGYLFLTLGLMGIILSFICLKKSENNNPFFRISYYINLILIIIILLGTFGAGLKEEGIFYILGSFFSLIPFLLVIFILDIIGFFKYRK